MKNGNALYARIAELEKENEELKEENEELKEEGVCRIAELKEENEHLNRILKDRISSKQLFEDKISSKQLQSNLLKSIIATLNSTNPDDDGRWNEDDDTASSSLDYLWNRFCGRLTIFRHKIKKLKEENQKLKHKMVMLEIKQAVDIKQ